MKRRTRLSERQHIGQALEQLTYDVLKQTLQSRIGITGEEKDTKQGIKWIASNYRLFWNKHRVKQGEYPKYFRIKGEEVLRSTKGLARKRLADLVLADIRVPLSDLDNKETYPKAILAIECKNSKLDFKWASVKQFDRGITSRFIWGDSQIIFDRLRMFNWERYAEFSNLYPHAIRVLITPRFAFSLNANREPANRKMSNLDDFTRWIVQGDIIEGLRPKTWSQKDQIEWRIMRIKLKIHELDYQILPDAPIPQHVQDRMRGFLAPYMDQLGIS
jgi:hypothetical protein